VSVYVCLWVGRCVQVCVLVGVVACVCVVVGVWVFVAFAVRFLYVCGCWRVCKCGYCCWV
jgi:hypothetical protein